MKLLIYFYFLVFALEKRETKNTIIAIQSLTNELENEQTTFSRSPAQVSSKPI